MKVLITGSGGQVGHCLVSQLAGKAELLAVDRNELNITDKVAVARAITQFKPDYIINAAAHTAVDKAEDEIDLSYAINRDGPAYLADAAKKIGAVLLHISTDYVYDGDSESVYDETMPCNPQSVYGKSKLAGELAVAAATDKFLIMRTAWVFGEHGNNFVKTMLRLGATREVLSIVGDQFGGPTYAGDIAGALIKMVDYLETGKIPEWGIYHFSGMPHVSWFDFAKAIFVHAAEKSVLQTIPVLTSIPTSAYPTRAKRPVNSRLNCQKINAQFGIEPSNWQLALNNIHAYK
ncbi:dTDP-4-dehydrorhamnose reductase [Prodigiosinella confusarubida]|uniref:dTDP-4-dehydrorhamnose reductase n=1 Tax=Serratia sp. (strain ATCC 39006) TaxID=104623 RepID=A0A2I5TC67_SERS3|nr:dTDP-4-dehydrorhamnose reductase [Serratia sp. ATCC 39006]AUH02170.1 dTDP-4-dehydrorhamnose reductase [Serratia sp. ATCC 39006]AUH06491.1 dTDP-4-dehydrorhamnose reductase [Serratia sp. ATCC 39006]